MSGVTNRDTVGILPTGALGVSFFYYLTGGCRSLDSRVVFLERSGSKSGRLLREKGTLSVEGPEGDTHSIEGRGLFLGDLLTAYREGTLPEILFVCPNTDQVLQVLFTMVELLEKMEEDGVLDVNDIDIPVVVMCSNGIFYQRARQAFIERIEEGIMLGKLPELWPHAMPEIVTRLLRGLTMQTGLRKGTGPNAIYHAGPPGITMVSGGNSSVRKRTCSLLGKMGSEFQDVGDRMSPTQTEFKKALINLACNLVGALACIDREGKFTPLRIEDYLNGANMPDIRQLAEAVFAVGKAVRVYGEEEDFEDIFQGVLSLLAPVGKHTASTIQLLGERLDRGTLKPGLTPTEKALLEPLGRYAGSAGLPDTSRYFDQMSERLVEKVSLAIAYRNREGKPPVSTVGMNGPG